MTSGIGKPKIRHILRVYVLGRTASATLVPRLCAYVFALPVSPADRASFAQDLPTHPLVLAALTDTLEVSILAVRFLACAALSGIHSD